MTKVGNSKIEFTNVKNKSSSKRVIKLFEKIFYRCLSNVVFSSWILFLRDINPLSRYVLGVERVVKGKRQYAFLMESTTIEYKMERNCEIDKIGGLIDNKGYGIAMPRGNIIIYTSNYLISLHLFI